jgi:hypothetical protein
MKSKWLIALAVMLAAFGFGLVGCGGGGGDLDDEDNYTKVVLGVAMDDFNTWGGTLNKDDKTKSSQLGWATDGFTWDDDAEDPKVVNYVAEKKGYNLDDFQKAKYLVLMMNGSMSGGLHLIWGGCVGEGTEIDEEATEALGGWNDASVTSSTGQAGASYGSTFKDGKLTIELAQAFKAKNYAGYVSEDATAVRLLLAYYSSNLSDLGLTGAYLLVADEIPEIPEPPKGPDTGGNTWPDDYEFSGVSVVVGPNDIYGNNFIINAEWEKLEAAADYSYLVVKVDVTNGEHNDNADWGYGNIGEGDNLVFYYGEVGDDMISTNVFLISSILEGREWPNAQVNLWEGMDGETDVISMQIWSPK